MPKSLILIGSEVEFKNPFEDERGLTFTVLQIDKNWCLLEANVDMRLKPTYTASLSDLKVVSS
jgi:hypothetical protein